MLETGVCLQAKGRAGEEEESEVAGGSEVSESHLGLRMHGAILHRTGEEGWY